MCRIEMPAEARKIIDDLYREGYEAYIVGGCVRDALLGRKADDYDITTSAPPTEIKRIFKRTVDTGLSHGTVTVIENGKPYEVTTFRVDGEYKDNRHPVSVSYTKNVRDDLARRDFTVNALAYNDREGIVDAFSGIEDLNDGVIRCVRNPEERFAEDALRVLRGIRFSSVLGFKIEEGTKAGIRKYAKNLSSISSERIYVEWKKLLSGSDAYGVISEFKEVIDVFAEELVGIEMPPRESFCSLSYDERQILLFVLSKSCDSFLSFAKRIKMDSKTRDTGISVLNYIKELESSLDLDPRVFIVGKDDEAVMKSVKIAAALGISKKSTLDAISALIESDAPRKISQLKINGHDLIKLGIKGEGIGKALSDVLVAVATGTVENDQTLLFEYIKAYKCKL